MWVLRGLGVCFVFFLVFIVVKNVCGWGLGLFVFLFFLWGGYVVVVFGMYLKLLLNKHIYSHIKTKYKSKSGCVYDCL